MKLSIKLMEMTQFNSSLSSRKILPFTMLALGLILIAVPVYFILRDISPQTNLSAVPVRLNVSAPKLTLSDTHSSSHSLAEYRGKVVLVNLWATWCPPCKEEMPILESFFNKHKEKGFVIIAINDGDPTPDVLQFVRDYELTFPVWLDPNSIATEQAFKTLNLPSSYVIDRNGRIQLMWVGGISRKTLDQYVVPLITETQ